MGCGGGCCSAWRRLCISSRNLPPFPGEAAAALPPPPPTLLLASLVLLGAPLPPELMIATELDDDNSAVQDQPGVNATRVFVASFFDRSAPRCCDERDDGNILTAVHHEDELIVCKLPNQSCRHLHSEIRPRSNVELFHSRRQNVVCCRVRIVASSISESLKPSSGP
jgi:hypothetical protein